MDSLARVFAYVRREIIQDEQNPSQRILLADPFETLADSLFLLSSRELKYTLTRKSIEPDRWFI